MRSLLLPKTKLVKNEDAALNADRGSSLLASVLLGFGSLGVISFRFVLRGIVDERGLCDCDSNLPS